ncbi:MULTISPECIES: 1,6-anhydro-N-acetylmuramyl-L-alanine amidase AmpD [unclassified Psychrobacter]|uniref:1,6-anhydro-N-acetylmuramyl-L-alanine amidase AmpD n=1 Tax=unclassified Psychrobacter TaxID=196806 RepID=UPI003FD425F0
MSTSITKIKDHRLLSATWLASPNFNERPKGKDGSMSIDTIVIHNISLPPDEFGGCDSDGLHYVKALFTNQLNWSAHPYFKSIEGAEVSAHLLIERDGRVTQFVPFDKRAWHAGKSSYLGRPECNDYSIGIELEGSDFQAFTDEQYIALTDIITAIYHAYPKTRRHLTGHSDIAPGRKSDPGEYFDWVRLRQMINQNSER